MPVETITERTQYLSFYLDKEQYALEITQVREVLDYTRITKVPRTPDYMLGVINLRGSVVPVIDMCINFGLPKIEQTRDTCIIIVEVVINGEKTLIGALANSVKEVFEMDPDMIEPAPKVGTRLNTEFIKGMGKHKESFVIILDINKVFTLTEINLLKDSIEDKPEEKNKKARKNTVEQVA
ncbi:MAG TPA: chemotaxis protein CheW [bacterium]|nr:chemotaxis protein CheW [bacterium]HPN43962.1 chemotaxis protein CheW [bacterium]